MSAPAPIPEAPALREGETLAGRFQVVRPFSARSRSGCRFATFELDDGRRTLRAYAWESDCQGFQVPRHRDRVYAAGRIRWRNARFELVCRELRAEDTAARIQWAKGRLREVVRALEPCLREFLHRVFSDPDIGTAFLAAPASLNHHHAFPGGLLVHSAETAWSVFRWTSGDGTQGLATTGALLHDIGKVRALTPDMTRTPLGCLVRHEALTLEVLAHHLAWLDGASPELGTALRHLLTWEPRRDDPTPGLAAMELVRAADRISAHHAPSSPVVMSHRPEA